MLPLIPTNISNYKLPSTRPIIILYTPKNQKHSNGKQITPTRTPTHDVIDHHLNENDRQAIRQRIQKGLTRIKSQHHQSQSRPKEEQLIGRQNVPRNCRLKAQLRLSSFLTQP
jgi:hypothetical protein